MNLHDLPQGRDASSPASGASRPARIADLRYDLRAGDLADERPTVAELQRRRALAVKRGDFRFARAFGLVVEHRLAEAARA